MRRERTQRRRTFAPDASDATGGVFRREGEYWTIAFEGTLFRLRDLKGLHYLARLLRHPGEKLSARDLVVDDGKLRAPISVGAERARFAVTKRIKDALQKIRANHPSLGDHLVANVKTGRLCVYAPDPRQKVSWLL